MKTPIYDFVSDYLKKEGSRLHMPGHKGAALLGCEARDITEILGADALYEAEGIIAQSEENATGLFGTGKTLFSTEGSSHIIRAMVFLAFQNRRPQAGRPCILAARNVHKSFLFACALVDCDVKWLYPAEEAENSICACQPTPEAVERALNEGGPLPFAVYVTSPDYLGHMADIKAISAVCREHGVPLLVDNAHGAYLRFLPSSSHPMDQGAFLCCDSAHKTLPVLTGGAYLHLSTEAWEQFGAEAKDALVMTGTTSPSYLILQSLDLCNRYLEESFRKRLSGCVTRLEQLKTTLSEGGIPLVSNEPLKLTVDGAAMGYSGRELGDLLRAQNGEPEFTDENYLVCMFTPENRERDFQCVEKALLPLKKRSPKPYLPLHLFCLKQRMTLREAIFAQHEWVPLEQAAGRVCGEPTISCPPAVPIAVSGEALTAEALSLFAVYGQKKISVVKE